ncbi:hypothetical protein MKW98_021596 [Papaver atlanticum]|uniref:F-box associated domain-containing protein n=1 Tax=Papaver atlanticum TaxID=357466 RepID=A0AAD4TC27_9MAGN|nr:hypothetical protein MKW98_021596 [Papaver atlanticum]
MSCGENFFNPESGLRDYVPTDPEVIIAFDVGSEKFRVIPIPSFILDDPGEKMSNGPIAMLILGGRITLIYQMSSRIVKLWMLDDDGVEKRLENCRGKGSSNWRSETITLPNHAKYFKFHGFATNVHDKLGQLFSYDRKTEIWEEIEMDRSFLLLPLLHGRSLFTTYSESLFPVQPQQEKSRQSELVF